MLDSWRAVGPIVQRGSGFGCEVAAVARSFRIRVYPDKVLRRPAGEIDPSRVDEEVARLASGLLQTMYAGRGVGLAGPQVAVPLRMITVDPEPEKQNGTVMLNPVIVARSGRRIDEEGCLSVPDIRGKVQRSGRVSVEYVTLEGEKTGLEAEGMLARILQHEIDHLDGILFIDRLSPAGKLAIRQALKRLEGQER